VLSRLEVIDRPGVLLGLSNPDDAAVLRTAPECDTVVTSDFFAAPLDDPFIVGRIAAVNSLSDVFATGGKPTAAIAHVTVPGGNGNAQQALLYELLAGAVRELNAHGAALVGGHTTEGPELTIGFTVIGCVKSRQMLTKGGLRPGDVLVLTKPLGSGILLAALMQAKLPWPSWEPLIVTMLGSNAHAASRLTEFDVRGVTDVTGFGLAGHLHEMLSASHAAAEIHINRVPLLPGVVELMEQGVQSTLAPANRHIEPAIDADDGVRASPCFAALFDPQTSGGLLFGVPHRRIDDLRRALGADDCLQFAEIGRVVASGSTKQCIRVRDAL
jgi:selenide,water dikinase